MTFSQVELCSHGDQLHRVGDSWEDGDCTTCRCEPGGVSRCEVSECSQTQPCWEVDTEESEGQCCPVCKGVNRYVYMIYELLCVVPE